MTELAIQKHDTGKWVCAQYGISMTHSNGVVCVAVSDQEIGVDLELIRPQREGMAERVMNGAELAAHRAAPDRNDHFVRVWSKKESLFKTLDQRNATWEQIRALDGAVYQQRITIAQGSFWLSVATPYLDQVRIVTDVDLAKD